MKLESINIWFVFLLVSVSHSICSIMDLETHCFHSSVDYVFSEFIFWATSFFGTFRKKSNAKVFWSEKFGPLAIKSVHNQPDSPSWYKCGGVCQLKYRESGLQIIALTGRADPYFK